MANNKAVARGAGLRRRQVQRKAFFEILDPENDPNGTKDVKDSNSRIRIKMLSEILNLEALKIQRNF